MTRSTGEPLGGRGETQCCGRVDRICKLGVWGDGGEEGLWLRLSSLGGVGMTPSAAKEVVLMMEVHGGKVVDVDSRPWSCWLEVRPSSIFKVLQWVREVVGHGQGGW